jgi:hypothetical protein
MMKRLGSALAAVMGGLLLLGAGPAAAAQKTCDPFGAATFRGKVPTPKQVLGIDIGDRDVTTAESDAYVKAVDDASNRVVSGVAATSVQGRPLRYAIVGKPNRLTTSGLARVRHSAAALMDPSTPPREARAIAARDPEILWIAGNVHGGEESGTDASLRVLWELSDRSDCAAKQILDDAIVVLLPTQNPDGREADTRQNAYGFDLNRDWFARTQPETDGKLEMLRRFPPVLFVDAHERGGSNNYFFPPNADPIYHEISSQSIHWINDLYGPAMQKVFDARGIPYFNYSTYDLFYEGYGDTVPSTAFGAAGMTYEKSNADPASARDLQQYLTQWTTLYTAATHKQSILQEWHDGWVQAKQEGRRGELEPNEVVQPENHVQQPVPDIKVRQYFLRNDDPSKAREVQALVRRLQRMDVQVRRLTKPLTVPDYTEYGRATREERLPAGTYVVSMAQRQKHWVQAMLNENTYVPFPYFYDVTAWSQPLLFDVDGGYSGRRLADMRSAPVTLQSDPGVPSVGSQPQIAVYSMSPQFSRGIESSGWLRYLLDRWGLQYRQVTAADIKAGGLAGADVLLVPDGYATQDPDAPDDPYGLGDLGADGAAAIRQWVEQGGRYVGWLDGAVLGAGVGVSSATFENAEDLGISSPGALIRVRAQARSPLDEGVGKWAYAFWDSRYVMHANGAPAPVRFPAASTRDFFVSGYADGADALGSTDAVVDEPVGEGRSVVFSFEPNFRAFTDGTQKLLRNAILGSSPRAAVAARGARIAATRSAARSAARNLGAAHDPVRLVVASRGANATRSLLSARGLGYRTVRAGKRVTFLIDNPSGASGDEVPWARSLANDLRRTGAPVVMFRVP